jgi:hypothetical protein
MYKIFEEKKKQKGNSCENIQKFIDLKLVLALGQTRPDLFWSLNVLFKYLFGYLISNSNSIQVFII